MSEYSKAELCKELEALKLAPKRPPVSRAPLNYLKQCCPVLLNVVQEALSSIGVTARDVEGFTKKLLEEVAFASKVVEVQQAGDLLGITWDQIDIDQIIQNYKRNHPSDAPAKTSRYGLQIRKVIAAHRDEFDYSITYNARSESRWMNAFVDALCIYLDNENDRLAAFSREYSTVPQSPDNFINSRAIVPLTFGGDASAINFKEKDNEFYVQRKFPEAEFRRLVKEGASIICFTGPPAIGKTKLAEHLTNTEKAAGDVTLLIQAGGTEQLERSLSNALRLMSVLPPQGLVALEFSFRDNIAKVSPRYLFIDNVTDYSVLERIVPTRTSTTVVITTNRRIRQIPERYCIEVGEFDPLESEKLILSLLPGTTKSEASKLASTLDHHPMAITASCGMIADGSISIEGFNAGILEASSAIFDGVDEDGHRMLTSVYRQVLSTLSRTDPVAALLLEMISILDDREVYTHILEFSLLELPQYRSMNVEQAHAVVRRGITYLRQHFLISYHFPTAEDLVDMHQLARAIIRGILEEQRKRRLADVLLLGIFQCVEYSRNSGLLGDPGDTMYVYSSISYFYRTHALSAQLVSKGITRSTAQIDTENFYEAIARIWTAAGGDTSTIVVMIMMNPGHPTQTMLLPFNKHIKRMFGFSSDGSETIGTIDGLEIRTGIRTYVFQGRECVIWVCSWRLHSDEKDA